MTTRKPRNAPAKQVNPIVAEFQQSCKVLGFTDEEIISDFCTFLGQSETSLRIVHRNITPALAKVILRVFQKYPKIQQFSMYACICLDASFYKQLATDLMKSPITNLALNYMSIQTDLITPFLSCQSLDVLSLRGVQSISTYDNVSHEWGPFSTSLNLFFNTLTTSTLKVLNLYGCNLGDAGAFAIANCLYFNTNLKCICLSHNRIGDNGASALASALSSYYLSENENVIVERLMNEESKQKITDEGGSLLKKKKGQKAPNKKAPPKAIKKGQQTSRPITERCLSFDPRAPVIPAILAKWNSCITASNGMKVLPGNTTLTTLLLDENQISHHGAVKLAEMLKANSKLVFFSVNSNPDIEPAEAQQLFRSTLPDDGNIPSGLSMKTDQ